MGVTANVTALVVAIVGVAGTFASGVITQLLSGRARTREIAGQEASSERDARLRSDAEARQAQRTEVKSAIASYLEVAQRVQTQLYAREHGRDYDDVALMVEQIWAAHDQVDILCSTELRSPLLQHTNALNEVARHQDRHPDWWQYVAPYNAALLDAVRIELERPELTASGRSP